MGSQRAQAQRDVFILLRCFLCVDLGPMLPSESTYLAAALDVELFSCTKSWCLKCAFVKYVCMIENLLKIM